MDKICAGSTDAKNPDLEKKNLKPFREAFNGPIIAAGGYRKETAEAELKEGTADLVCFGRWYLANPDFPVRFLPWHCSEDLAFSLTS